MRIKSLFCKEEIMKLSNALDQRTAIYYAHRYLNAGHTDTLCLCGMLCIVNVVI